MGLRTLPLLPVYLYLLYPLGVRLQPPPILPHQPPSQDEPGVHPRLSHLGHGTDGSHLPSNEEAHGQHNRHDQAAPPEQHSNLPYTGSNPPAEEPTAWSHEIYQARHPTSMPSNDSRRRGWTTEAAGYRHRPSYSLRTVWDGESRRVDWRYVGSQDPGAPIITPQHYRVTVDAGGTTVIIADLPTPVGQGRRRDE